MKINKNLRRVVVTLVLIGAGFVYGKQTGEQEILNRWDYLVGNEISKVSFPKTFKPSGNNAPGILIINVQRGNEISVEFSKNSIIEKINSFFGYKVLNNIRLETFNNLKENKLSIIPGYADSSQVQECL